jgi:hypothetical protein
MPGWRKNVSLSIFKNLVAYNFIKIRNRSILNFRCPSSDIFHLSSLLVRGTGMDIFRQLQCRRQTTSIQSPEYIQHTCWDLPRLASCITTHLPRRCEVLYVWRQIGTTATVRALTAETLDTKLATAETDVNQATSVLYDKKLSGPFQQSASDSIWAHPRTPSNIVTKTPIALFLPHRLLWFLFSGYSLFIALAQQNCPLGPAIPSLLRYHSTEYRKLNRSIALTDTMNFPKMVVLERIPTESDDNFWMLPTFAKT